jgi:uncharacterized protein
MDLLQKTHILEEIIKKHAPLLIAYSGGVDSSLLAAITRETLGEEKMQCILVDGPEVPRRGLFTAVNTAEELQIPLKVVPGRPFSDELKQENPHDRCRYCKLGTYEILESASREFRCHFIADGANASDLCEHRPGIEAFSSCGVIHPFIMAGITKLDIRTIAQEKGFSFWNKPSSACLYSRIPYGEILTNEKLHMIEKGEEILADLGITQVRVRHHGTIARIEVLPGEMDIAYKARNQIQKNFKQLGFLYVTLDLFGYRSGSMDDGIP